MHLVLFTDFETNEPIYVNPEHVRAVLPYYDGRERASVQIVLGAYDTHPFRVRVTESLGDVVRLLQGAG